MALFNWIYRHKRSKFKFELSDCLDAIVGHLFIGTLIGVLCVVDMLLNVDYLNDYRSPSLRPIDEPWYDDQFLDYH